MTTPSKTPNKTTTLALWLMAKLWLDKLCFELGARPPARTRRDLTSMLVLAAEALLDGDGADALTIEREVRRLLTRWPGGTPGAAQAHAGLVLDVTPIVA